MDNFVIIEDGLAEQIIEFNSVAEFRHVGLDPNDVLCIWAEVYPDETRKFKRKIFLVGTGRPIPNDSKYMGTVTMGDFIWHVHMSERNIEITDAKPET